MHQETAVQKPQQIGTVFTRYAPALLQIALGSIFLGLMAQVAIPIPYSPVPITLQTLAVALLAISLGPIKAPLAVGAYLLQATAGLPVLAGGLPNPLWMIGPRAGYLASYLVASYFVGRLLNRQQQPSFFRSWLILSLNETVILTIGTLWLTFFYGWTQAFLIGMLPFIPGGLIKISVAATAVQPTRWVKKKWESLMR